MFITELRADIAFVQAGGYGQQGVYTYRMPANRKGFEAAEQCAVDPTKSRLNFQSVGPAIAAINDNTDRAEREAVIAGGWQAPRLAFNLNTRIYQTGNSTRTEMVSGYTEPYDHQPGDEIPDDLKVYFNRTYVLNSQRVSTPEGETWITDILRDWAIVTGRTPDGAPWSQSMMIRPADVFSQLGTPAPFQDLLNRGETMDMRSRFSNNGIAMAQQRHSATSHYVTDAVQAYLEAMNDGMGDTALEDLFSDCRGRVVDPLSNSSPFLEMVIRDTDYRSDGYLTWGELKRIFEGRLEVTTYTTRQEPDFMVNGYDNTWQSAVANRLVHTIQAQFGDYGYHSMSFQYVNGQILFTDAARAFRADNDREVFEQFKERLVHEINMLSSRELVINVELNQQQALVEVSEYLAGEESVRFVIPTFCLNLMSPLVTTEMSVMTDAMQFIDFLVRTICDPNVSRA